MRSQLPPAVAGGGRRPTGQLCVCHTQGPLEAIRAPRTVWYERSGDWYEAGPTAIATSKLRFRKAALHVVFYLPSRWQRTRDADRSVPTVQITVAQYLTYRHMHPCRQSVKSTQAYHVRTYHVPAPILPWYLVVSECKFGDAEFNYMYMYIVHSNKQTSNRCVENFSEALAPPNCSPSICGR